MITNMKLLSADLVSKEVKPTYQRLKIMQVLNSRCMHLTADEIYRKLVKEIPIALNNTILMIGQIEHLFISEQAILNDGSVNLNCVNDVCITGLDTYHKVSNLKTFPYAKVDNLPKFK